MFSFVLSTYVSILLLICILVYSKIINKNSVNIFTIILFLLFIVFRPLSLPDNIFYTDLYEYYNILPHEYSQRTFLQIIKAESGFYILTSICKYLYGSNNYQLFFLTISLVNLVLFSLASDLFIKKYYDRQTVFKNNFIPLFLIYISYYGFMYNMIVLRAGIALSLLYYSVALLTHKKYYKFILVLLLSIFFHRSAILGVFLILSYIILPILSKKQYLILWFFILIIYLSRLDRYLSDLNINNLLGLSVSKDESLFGSYLANDYMITRYPLRTLYLILITPIFIIINKNEMFKLINIFLIGLLFQSLFQGLPAFGRATDFFIFFSVIISFLTYININNYLTKQLFLVIIVTINYIMFFRLTMINL